MPWYKEGGSQAGEKKKFLLCDKFSALLSIKARGDLRQRLADPF